MATDAMSFETESCAACKQPLGDEYYRAGSWKICTQCASKTRADEAANSATAYTRALIWGIGAAILGCALYAGFVILTNVSLGLMAIVAAWLVAMAMRKAAPRCGGRRYQITAALLIYAAVAGAFLPIGLARLSQHHTVTAVSVIFFAVASTVSPFIVLARNPGSGIFLLLIIFFGIRYAWRILRGSDPNVLGPFPNTIDS